MDTRGKGAQIQLSACCHDVIESRRDSKR